MSFTPVWFLGNCYSFSDEFFLLTRSSVLTVPLSCETFFLKIVNNFTF